MTPRRSEDAIFGLAGMTPRRSEDAGSDFYRHDAEAVRGRHFGFAMNRDKSLIDWIASDSKLADVHALLVAARDARR